VRYAANRTRMLLYCFDIPAVAIMVFGLLMATGGFLLFRIYITKAIGNMAGGITGGVVQGIVIYILNYIFETVSLMLTDKENQRTQAEWENSFVLKLFGFQFINTYTGLFYIAFVKYLGGLTTLTIFGQTDRCFPSLEKRSIWETTYPGFVNRTTAFSKCSDEVTDANFNNGHDCTQWPVCYAELQTALIGVLLTKLFSDAFFDYVYPWLMNVLAERAVAKEREEDGTGEKMDAADAMKSFGSLNKLYDYELEISLQKYDTPLYDYCQLVLNYGFIVMFAAAWPICPIVVLVYNIMQTIIDQNKLMRQFQRPMYEWAASIGVWRDILLILSFCGVLVNTLLLVVTTNDFQNRYSLSNFDTACYAIVLEHFIIILRLLIEYRWPDMPTRIIRCKALDAFEDTMYKKAAVVGPPFIPSEAEDNMEENPLGGDEEEFDEVNEDEPA